MTWCRMVVASSVVAAAVAGAADEPKDLDLRRMGPAEYRVPGSSEAVSDATPGPAGRVSLVALPDGPAPEVRGHRGIRLLVVNKSDGAARVLAYEGAVVGLVREAVDADGRWKPLEEERLGFACGVGLTRPRLDPGRSWELAAPRYDGRVKTRTRFRLVVSGDQGGWVAQSNEFDGWVNPEQFVPPPRDGSRPAGPRGAAEPGGAPDRGGGK